jgi:sterol desaturase/sphingolipid hydroxylase (fatty acid hydroxylase superfamily)
MSLPALLLPLTLGIYGVVATLERVSGLRFRASPFLRPFFRTDVFWQLSTFGVVLAARPFLPRLPTSPLTEGLHALAWPFAIGLAVVVYDLTAFLIHKGLHRSDVLWEIHKVHHSSRTLDWLAATRQHTAEGLLRNVPSQAVLFAVGFPPEAVAGAVLIYAAFAAMGHANLRIPLPSAECLFITPRLHRLHHVPASSGTNFATVFSFWDRLSGHLTVRDVGRQELLGVPDEVETYPQSFGRAFLEPIRRILAIGSERLAGGRTGHERSLPR